MPIPLLEYAPISKNHRVEGFEVPGDEQPMLHTTDNLPVGGEMDVLIKAAYRQVFNEQQMLDSYRQKFLESQLKAAQITVRDFIRSLVLSDNFRRLVYDSNDNYRFVQICVQRLLGREVYGEREKLAWSIVLATKGLNGFVDDLLDSDEYLENFGYDTVPYHRRRIIPQRAEGEITFEHMARYGTNVRDKSVLARRLRRRSSKLNEYQPIIFDLSDRSTQLQFLAYAGIVVALLILWYFAGSLEYR